MSQVQILSARPEPLETLGFQGFCFIRVKPIDTIRHDTMDAQHPRLGVIGQIPPRCFSRSAVDKLECRYHNLTCLCCVNLLLGNKFWQIDGSIQDRREITSIHQQDIWTVPVIIVDCPFRETAHGNKNTQGIV